MSQAITAKVTSLHNFWRTFSDRGSLLIPSPQSYNLHSAGLVHRTAAQTYRRFAGAGLVSAAGRHSSVPKEHSR